MIKVTLEDFRVPNICDECKFIGRYEDGVFARSPHCCCEFIYHLKEEDYRVDKNSLDENCPLKFIKEKINMNHTNSSSLSITTKLPTKEEFEASVAISMEGMEQYSDPRYLCPECKEGGMCKNLTMILASYPPKYLYKCNKCGHVDYQSM